MEKNVLGKGQYVTTGTMFIRGEFKPEGTKLALSEQGKEAILEYLTESDEFHKLVCDITGVERKQVKVYQELEKLKEVKCSSVRGIVDELKAERANGKLLAEDIELCRRENDRLKQRYDNVCNEIKEIEKNRNNLSDNYDRLIKDYNCLITRYNNQKEYIAQYIEENKRLINEVEKLKGRLNRASKNYDELIKAINDKAMKSI